MTRLTIDNKKNIEIIKEAVKSSFVNYPILQQMTLAQAILESRLQPAMKPSSLALKYCNLFGMKPGKIIKTGTANPGIVELETKECDKYHCWTEPQPFLANNNIEDSFKQHELLFESLERYRPLFSCVNLKDACYAVARAGYATNPHYAEELYNTARTYLGVK